MVMELLAPAGDYQKFLTAMHFGADAVYIGGKDFNLRAFCENFTMEEIAKAAEYAHARGKKIYVALNIFAHTADFKALPKFVVDLAAAKVDAVIVSDMGVMNFVKEFAPALDIHLSTQANVTNVFSALAYARMGVKRIVLARELSLKEIADIHFALPKGVEVETFAHGAMCISYSGRCLLSNYLTDRNSNKGECAQPCRWEYSITEKSREGEQYTIEEDKRGTYILNSRDLNMLPYINQLHFAGIKSLKIEGRAKSAYYTATVINAYRRALDLYAKTMPRYQPDETLLAEPANASNRGFTTGFYFENKTEKENLRSSAPQQNSEFIAEVLGSGAGTATVEQRNKFQVGETLEILSPDDNFLKTFKVEKITDELGTDVTVADKVKAKLTLNCPYKLSEKDILRRKKQ